MSFLRFSLSVLALVCGLEWALSMSLPFPTPGSTLHLQSPSSVSGYLIQNDWKVYHNSVHCQTSSCCCFDDMVNIYSEEHGILYVNGSVSGTKCRKTVERDNLPPPTSYTFAAEFFSIDDFVFTLANATLKNGSEDVPAWTFTGSTASTSCSFQLIRAASEPLAPQPPYSPPKPPLTIPDYVSPYLGNWTFDSTSCNQTSPSCCCFVGWANITVDADNDPNLIASGPPSVGCGLGPFIQLESDDFPFPKGGTATSSNTEVDAFLAFQESYQISLSYPQNNLFSLSFANTNTPMCSMRATRVGSPPSGRDNNNNSVVVAVAVVIVVIVLLAAIALGVHYCRKTRASRRGPSHLSDKLTQESSHYDNLVEVADR